MELTVFEILVLRVCPEEWNTEFHPNLKRTAEPQDIHINKNRLSGFWGGTGIEDALRKRYIRTLLFAGENTDQCVAGTIRDAYTKGWDCLMLSDACATTSPEFAKKCTEYKCEGGWGFVLSCKDLADGVGCIDRGTQHV
ncbi:isochorismatase [Fusarium oxysporum f. sp. phaseoli]